MYMKPIKTFLIITTIVLAACQSQEEPAPGTRPVPATITRAHIQQAAAATRAGDIDGAGYRDVEKVQFVSGDRIDIAYYHGQKPQTAIAVGEPGTGTEPEWTTDPAPLYINPGDEANITATHLSEDDDETGADGTTRYADILEGTATVDYTASPAQIAFSFAHARSLLLLGTITEAATGNTLTVDRSQPITVDIDDATVALTGGQAICPAAGTIQSIAFTLDGGKTYNALPLRGSSITTQPGHSHTLNITLAAGQATITSTNINPWGQEETPGITPAGYDRYIYNEDDLIAFRDATNSGDDAALAAKVIQMKDIVLTREWDWPIADIAEFTGLYNGNGYTITGLTVNFPGYAALFGWTNGATLTNIHLRQVDLTGDYAAALVGLDEGNTTISLCSTTGNATGNAGTGGLVVVLGEGSTLLRSRATCTLTGNGSFAGGLIGYNSSATILGCMAGGSITGTATRTGGLVGYNDAGAIYHSYSTIDTGNANTCVAGLNNNSTIYSSYGVGGVYTSTGNVLITDGTAPGDIVRTGEHTITVSGNNVLFKGASIWGTGDYPTLRYSYEGE